MHDDDERGIGPDFRWFVLDRAGRFADRIAQHLGATPDPHEDRAFEDGEHKLRPRVSVRNADVYVVQSLYGEPEQTVHDKIVKLLLFTGALKDASAQRVTAVVPYLAYARKDRRTKPRDPVATRYIAQMFEAMGVDCVVTVDVHNLAAFQNAFRCRTEHLEAAPLFVHHFEKVVHDDPVTVVAPDAGGIKRAEAFRVRLERALARPVAMAFAEKHRSAGVVSGEAFLGDVTGRIAIIVDDLISSGTTIARVAAACHARGALRVYAVATHGVFAPAADGVLGEAPVDAVVVTDTVASVRVSAAHGLHEKLVVLPAGGLLAEAMIRLHTGASLVELAEE